jgi:hypothetical protein
VRVEAVALIVLGLVAGYLGHWAQLKFLDDPRERRKQREATMGTAAEALYPALEKLRSVGSGTAIDNDPGGDTWYGAIDEQLSAFVKNFYDGWKVDMDDEVQAAVMNMIGAETQLGGSTTMQHPAYRVMRDVERLTARCETLYALLVRRSKGHWGKRPSFLGAST